MEHFRTFAAQNPGSVPYSITGSDCQIVSVSLKHGEAVTTEPGTMMVMSTGMTSDVKMGNCSRVCVGESCCKIIYKNSSTEEGFLALTPNTPAKVVPIDLSTLGPGGLIARGGMYMSHLGDSNDLKLVANVQCCSCACCCGGMGFATQHITGKGTVFLAAGGSVLTKKLAVGETIVVDTNGIVGYEESVKMAVRTTGGCCNMCCGGEGMFNTTLTGPGLIIIQTMSFEKYRAAIVPPTPPTDGNKK